MRRQVGPGNTCSCIEPNGGNNGYACADGKSGHCAVTEACYATRGFQHGDWGAGCRNKPSPPPPPPSTLITIRRQAHPCDSHWLCSTVHWSALEQAKWCELNAFSPGCVVSPMVARLIAEAPDLRVPRIEHLRLSHPTEEQRGPLPRGTPALLLSPAPKVCFIHVNKAGGSALLLGLNQLLAHGSISGWAEIHGLYPQMAPNASRVVVTSQRLYPPGPIRPGSCLGPKYTMVLWVRDPVHRVLSCWNFMTMAVARVTKPRFEASQFTRMKPRPVINAASVLSR